MTLATSLQPGAKRALLRGLLGRFDATRFEVGRRRMVAGCAPGMQVEQLELVDGRDRRVRAYLTGPLPPWNHRSAVLYIHAHGNRYDIGASELLTGRPALCTPAYGEVLAAAGIVALAIDLPCFGERAGESEQATAKRHLWHGRTLFGAMLADLEGAFSVLAGIEGVDAGRIGTFGISMGATLGFWLAALDTRIKALAHLCCFCDLEILVETGAHDLHGNYMTVPGLLAQLRTGEIAGLAAPRPQLVCLGLADPLTPADAVQQGLEDLQRVYVDAGAAEKLETLVSPDTGHVETPAMRAAVVDFLLRRL